MTKRDRETAVENVLKRWRKLQEEIKVVEDDAANMAFSQGSGEPVQSSSISDKTARGAFLLESIAEKKAWVECDTEGMKWLDEEHPELRKLLYGHWAISQDLILKPLRADIPREDLTTGLKKSALRATKSK